MENWQLKCEQINQRGTHLLESGIWSDCQFIVGDGQDKKKFSSHKIILSMSSPVFEAMFYGGLAEADRVIEVPDIQPDAFKAMLEYIYEDKITLTTAAQACDLCIAAKKYILPFLEKKCTSFIQSNVKNPDAIKVYEFAKLYEEANLMQHCMEIISRNTAEIVSDDSFTNVTLDSIMDILDCEMLNISSEMELLSAVYNWAVHECQRQGFENNNKERLRAVINPALSKIRILTLQPTEFASWPLLLDLLTEKEAFVLLRKISASSAVGVKVPEGFSESTTKRRANFMPACLAPVDCKQVVLDWNSANTQQITKSHKVRLEFNVSERIDLIGITMPSQTKFIACNTPQDEGNYKENLQIVLMEQCSDYSERQRYHQGRGHYYDYNEEVICKTQFKKNVSFNNLLDIRFNQPVFLEFGYKYVLEVQFYCGGTYRMGTISEHSSYNIDYPNLFFQFVVKSGSTTDCIVTSFLFKES